MTEQLAGDYDYIIVGGGTAGCVLANRLSADPKTRVLLLEAGGKGHYHWVHIPVGYLYCIGNPRVDWMMKTAAEPGLNGRSLVYPRGKVLGGCTSINGMIYMRGQAADYDGWRQMGNTGWGWDDVLPYFRRSEDHHKGESDLHGAGGEWKVTTQRLSWEILRAFQEGAREFGYEPTEDFNSGTNEGSGFFEVNQRNGVRWNTTKAFLRPAMNRPNLRVLTRAETQRLILDGKRVTGVAFRHGGQDRTATARAEVLLAAGAINSPKLMELSGIGQPDRLSALGIAPVHDLPGVGENLQDHLQIRTAFKVSNTPTLNETANSLTGRIGIALKYALTRSGPLSMAPSQFGMFTKSDPALETPDLEYHVHRPPGRPAACLPGHHRFGLQPASRKRRRLPYHQRQDRTAAAYPAQLSERPARPAGRGGGRETGPPDNDGARARALCAAGIPARPADRQRCRSAARGGQHRHHDLSPGGHLQNG